MARTLTYYSPQYVSDVLTPEYKIVFGVAPYHLEEVSGLGASDINMVSQSLPLQHGAQFSRLQYEPRMITISGKLIGSITTQNANKATMSKALAYNNQAVREAWQADFWRLKAADSGITTAAQFVDFLYNLGGYGVIKYTSSGITTTKRINAIPYSGPVFKNKDGREPYQDFQVVFMAPYPFFEDDAYTLAIDEQDDSLTVDFEIEGDIPPRMVLHVEPTEATVSNNLELTVNARQNYTPEIAATAYVPTMIDMKSTAALKDNDLMYQSLINGEKQMYIDRTANKIAVAVGTASPYIATSTNGVDWTNATTVVGANWRGVSWSASLGRFVAVGYASPYIATSTDGVNWANATTVVGTSWAGVSWSEPLGRFVAVGTSSPYIATSTNGVDWANATTVVGTNWVGVSWSASLGRFVAVGYASPYIATSTDGINWANATTVVGTSWVGVSWSEPLGRFVAVGTASPYIATSTNGVDWANATTVVGANWRGVSWSASLGRFVAVGPDWPYMATSTNGVDWANATTVVGANWAGVSWSASLGRFVAVGTSSPYIATSTDGINWANATTVVGTSWLGVSSFPDPDQGPDTNSKLTRFRSLDCPPGDYRATMKADKIMNWKLYYRKAWLGI
jgi:uncharacterized protein (UPF0210 family)